MQLVVSHIPIAMFVIQRLLLLIHSQDIGLWIRCFVFNCSLKKLFSKLRSLRIEFAATTCQPDNKTDKNVQRRPISAHKCFRLFRLCGATEEFATKIPPVIRRRLLILHSIRLIDLSCLLVFNDRNLNYLCLAEQSLQIFQSNFVFLAL